MRFLLAILIVLIFSSSYGQPKKSGRVKRKYRNVEQITQNLPDVVLHGRVRDIYRNPLAGAVVEIEGLKRKVNTNANGRFLLKNLPTGLVRLKISFTGYRTKTIDYYLQAGINDHYLALDQDAAHLDPLPVSPQMREQDIPDIPAAISVITDHSATKYIIDDFSEVADFIPGLSFEDFGGGDAAFSVNGSSGSAGFPGLSPSVAVYADGVSLDMPDGFSSSFFDMERIEVLKGPRNVLFGRRASMGAVSLVSKQPGTEMNGYVSAGGGNFGQKRTEAAINFPVKEDLLYIRAAGIYNSRDGYIKDTTGLNFNGDNTMGGRLLVRLLPAYWHQIDLKLEYLKDDEPAVAFRNAWIPGMNGERGLSGNTVLLNGSDSAGAVNQLLDATLNYKLFRDEHTYLSLISSYRRGKSSSARDADGTSLPALFMESETNTILFFQEVRYNFSRRSRTNGSAGINYIRTGSEGTGRVISNDTYLFDLLNTPGSFIMPGESRYPVNPVPLNPSPMAGTDLPGDHAEEVLYNNKENSLQAWLHFDHQLTQKIFFNAGMRGAYDRIKMSREPVYSEGLQSELGNYSNADPNLLYAPGAPVSIKKSHLYVTGKAGFTYRWNEDFNIFINAIRGRRPGMIQFTWDNQSRILDAEILNSLEGGVKMSVLERVFLDVTGHYRHHRNVHTLLWGGTQGTGLNAASGKATSYGLDAGVQIALLKGFNMFGSYSWLNAVFDSTDTEGRDFVYAGNSFAFLPRHSFTSGVSINLELRPSLSLFANTWYSWRSHFWFSEANTPGTEQSAYGILNAATGLKLTKPAITFTVHGSNLLDENYILSAGHWGGQFGLPTFVNGSPLMLGVKMLWDF